MDRRFWAPTMPSKRGSERDVKNKETWVGKWKDFGCKKANKDNDINIQNDTEPLKNDALGGSCGYTTILQNKIKPNVRCEQFDEDDWRSGNKRHTCA